MLNTNEQIRTGRIREPKKSNFERFDSIVGIITRCGQYGCYVTDEETGAEVFFNGNGTRGDRVRLGVKKIKPETNRTYWVLESVLEYGEIAA